MSRPRKTRFYRDGVLCHLCGYPIPGWIISPAHPLFGTIDHVQPLSLGGTNRASNRATAHKCCNNWRGNLEITEELRDRLTLEVQKKFVGQPIPPRSQRWKRIREALRQK